MGHLKAKNPEPDASFKGIYFFCDMLVCLDKMRQSLVDEATPLLFYCISFSRKMSRANYTQAGKASKKQDTRYLPAGRQAISK